MSKRRRSFSDQASNRVDFSNLHKVDSSEREEGGREEAGIEGPMKSELRGMTGLSEGLWT